MAKWILLRSGVPGPIDYPGLGFSARPGDVYSGDSAPDAYWHPCDEGAAESVDRYMVPGGDDSAFASLIDDAGSDVRASLSATYVRGDAPPKVEAGKNGIRYDGTDETVAMQALLDTMAVFGAGVIELSGIVRCDGQLRTKTNVVGTQLRQPPLRITGTAQHMPGSAMQGVQYPADAGLDLRYAGRSDASCTTTLGSGVVGNAAATADDRGKIVVGTGIPDRAWILASEPGVGWTLSRPARATGTVSLTSFGGRFESFGYGMLELDHLQICNKGTASSAPLVVSTGTTIKAHDNLVMGSEGKSGVTCDEDPFILGGPGQGTALTTALTADIAVTSLAVSPLPVGILSGVPFTLAPGTANQALVTSSAAAAAGATSISITSFTPAVTHPVRTGVLLGGAQSATDATSISAPSAPFQGYGTRIRDNHFHRVRRIQAGAWASDVWIDHNAWMHNCGSNIAAAPSTLTTALTSGVAYTSLAVTALSRDVIAGDIIQVGVSPNSQETVASASAAAGATSVSVGQFTANAAYAVGTKSFNTAHLGAAVESHAAEGNANAVTVADNRIGMSGGYTHATRFTGPTRSSSIRGNSQQDHHANNIAVYRFDRGATSNVILGGLHNPAIPAVDDWAAADHSPSQLYLTGRPDDPLTVPFGIESAGGAWLPTPGAAAVYSPRFKLSSGVHWRFRCDDDDFFILHTILGGSETELFRLQNSPTGVNLTATLAATNEARIQNVTGHLKFTAKAGWRVFLGDQTLPSSVYALNGKMYADALVGKAYATASRPTPASVGVGGMIYDSTLTKPIWSDGTNWKDAAGAVV
jgi:hypothetical protein